MTEALQSRKEVRPPPPTAFMFKETWGVSGLGWGLKPGSSTRAKSAGFFFSPLAKIHSCSFNLLLVIKAAHKGKRL